MISCSISASFTEPQWLWMMNTSAPRLSSPNWQWISPLAKSRRFASPSGTPRCCAISWASAGWERPEYSRKIFLVTSSMRAPLPSAGCSVERAGAHPWRHVRARLEHGKGPDDGACADVRLSPNGVLDGGPITDRAVDEARVGPDLRALAHRRRPLEERAGEDRDVRREAHGGVDVGALGVDHRDASVEPRLVGPPAQRGLGRGELPAIVDALRLRVVIGAHRDDRVARVVQ